MKNYWLSWYQEKKFTPFEIHNPWWISGYRVDDEATTIVAAIKANDENEAYEKIYQSYDKRPEKIEFRFCNEFPDNKLPYSERFPKAEWMKWD